MAEKPCPSPVAGMEGAVSGGGVNAGADTCKTETSSGGNAASREAGRAAALHAGAGAGAASSGQRLAARVCKGVSGAGADASGGSVRIDAGLLQTAGRWTCPAGW